MTDPTGADRPPARVHPLVVLLAGYGWRLLILGAVVVATYRVLAELWVLVLTVVVALYLARVLDPPVRWLRSRGLAPARPGNWFGTS